MTLIHEANELVGTAELTHHDIFALLPAEFSLNLRTSGEHCSLPGIGRDLLSLDPVSPGLVGPPQQGDPNSRAWEGL